VRTIGAQRPDTTEVAVIVGVDTHLDFHVAVAVDHLGREAWTRPACRRPPRVTRGSCAGLRVSSPPSRAGPLRPGPPAPHRLRRPISSSDPILG